MSTDFGFKGQLVSLGHRRFGLRGKLSFRVLRLQETKRSWRSLYGIRKRERRPQKDPKS